MLGAGGDGEQGVNQFVITIFLYHVLNRNHTFLYDGEQNHSLMLQHYSHCLEQVRFLSGLAVSSAARAS